MKLNNHGWGFREMIFYMTILVIFLFLAVFLIVRMYRQMAQKNYDISDYFPEGETTSTTEKEILLYSDLELELKNGTVTYLKNYYDQELTSERVAITLTMLRSKSIITELKDIKAKTDCDGYVLVEMNKSLEVKYYPYIKCANYTTVGYVESYTK